MDITDQDTLARSRVTAAQSRFGEVIATSHTQDDSFNTDTQLQYRDSCTHSSKVTISFDSDREFIVSAVLIVDDCSESLDELSKDHCIYFLVLVSILGNEQRNL